MISKKEKKKTASFKKVVDESVFIPRKKGGGQIKVEVWESSGGQVMKYSIAYINPGICAADNGRVLGYDNSHGYHHKHFMGEVIEIDPFTSYRDILKTFETEVKAFIRK